MIIIDVQPHNFNFRALYAIIKPCARIIMLTIDRIKEVVSRIGRKYNVKYAYLFGSYAKGTANESSDVDIIVDMENFHKYKDYYHFCDELEKELGTNIDVTAEEGMLPGFFDLIKNDRIPLYGV